MITLVSGGSGQQQSQATALGLVTGVYRQQYSGRQAA